MKRQGYHQNHRNNNNNNYHGNKHNNRGGGNGRSDSQFFKEDMLIDPWLPIVHNLVSNNLLPPSELGVNFSCVGNEVVAVDTPVITSSATTDSNEINIDDIDDYKSIALDKYA